MKNENISVSLITIEVNYLSVEQKTPVKMLQSSTLEEIQNHPHFQKHTFHVSPDIL